MAEEQAAVAEVAPAQTEAAPLQETVLKDFGNLEEAFNRAFPATAPKKEEVTPVLPAAPTTVETAKLSETAVAPVAPKDELPDFLTGEKPKAAEQPPPGDPDIPPPTGKESVGMKQLRTAYENLKKQSQDKETEYKQLIEAAKAPSPDAPQIEQLQAQIKELETIAGRARFEERPEFKAFLQRRGQIVADAHQMLKDAGADPVQWERAMTLTGLARQQALDDLYEVLPRSIASELGAASRELRTLDSQKEAALANQEQIQKQWQQQEQQRQFQALKEHEKTQLNYLEMAERDLVDNLGIEVYKKSDNPEHKKWNDSIDKMKADAKKLLLEVDDPSVMARAVLLAPAAIQFRYLYHTYRDLYLGEKKKNEAVSAAEPSLKSGGEPPSADGDEKLSFADAVARQFR